MFKNCGMVPFLPATFQSRKSSLQYHELEVLEAHRSQAGQGQNQKNSTDKETVAFQK